MNNEQLDFYNMGLREAEDAKRQMAAAADLIQTKYGETAKAQFEAGILQSLNKYVEKTTDELDDALEARGYGR